MLSVELIAQVLSFLSPSEGEKLLYGEDLDKITPVGRLMFLGGYSFCPSHGICKRVHCILCNELVPTCQTSMVNCCMDERCHKCLRPVCDDCGAWCCSDCGFTRYCGDCAGLDGGRTCFVVQLFQITK